MSDIQIASVTTAFAIASTAEQYHAAKRQAARLSIPSQLRVVDTIIAARRRLMAGGVL